MSEEQKLDSLMKKVNTEEQKLDSLMKKVNTEEQKLDFFLSRFDLFSVHNREEFIEVRKELYEIRLGLYGNIQNNLVGVIDRQSLIESRLKKMEEVYKKLVWIGTGIYIIIQAVVVLALKFL